MKRVGSAVLALAFVAALASPAVVRAEPVKVKGDLIDVMCGSKKPAPAGHNESCATACAKRGEPIAVYTKDGAYVVTGKFTAEKNAKLIEFMGKAVEVTGEVTKDKDGKLSIDVTNIALVK
jgi:hypothetical protein